MDSTRISVSALGRDVVVGDFYNYYTDDVLKSKSNHQTLISILGNVQREKGVHF